MNGIETNHKIGIYIRLLQGCVMAGDIDSAEHIWHNIISEERIIKYDSFVLND